MKTKLWTLLFWGVCLSPFADSFGFINSWNCPGWSGTSYGTSANNPYTDASGNNMANND